MSLEGAVRAGLEAEQSGALALALMLAEEHGIPVFPCSQTKQPLTPHGFKDATASVQAIVDWWDRYPDALPAFPTGRASSLLVIDVDPAGQDWYSSNFARLECGYVQKTRRGYHLFYRAPDADIRNSAGKLAPGVDVRGEGGYVIAWGAQGLPATGSVLDVGPVPDWLLESLRKPHGTGSEAAIRAESKHYPEGMRNDRLFRLGCRLGRAGLDANEIYQALDRRNTTHCQPPLDPKEVVRIAESAARCVSPGRFLDDSEARAGQPQRGPLIVAAHEAAAEATVGEWLLRPYLEADVLALMYGDYGTLKSFIAVDWCARIALGLPAIGYAYRRPPAPVVYISAEGKGLWKRLRAWCQHNFPDEQWRDVLKRGQLYVIRRPLNLSAEDEVQNLAEHIEALGIRPVLIVVDTLSRNSNGEPEKSTDAATKYLNTLDLGLRIHFGATVLFIHHVGHGDKERHRGPIVLAANTDAEIRVVKPNRDKLEVTLEVMRLKDSDLPPVAGYRGSIVELGEKDGDGEIVSSLAIESAEVACPKRPEPNGKNRIAMLGAVRQYVAEHGDVIATPKWHELCKAQGLPKQRWSDTRQGLVDDGWLVECVGGVRYAP